MEAKPWFSKGRTYNQYDGHFSLAKREHISNEQRAGCVIQHLCYFIKQFYLHTQNNASLRHPTYYKLSGLQKIIYFFWKFDQLLLMPWVMLHLFSQFSSPLKIFLLSMLIAHGKCRTNRQYTRGSQNLWITWSSSCSNCERGQNSEYVQEMLVEWFL